MQKTLYISDLDGTLLQENEKISSYSVQTINRLIEQGMLFSYATARSQITAVKTTEGLHPKLPLILYNGAFMLDSASGKIMLSNFFNRTDVTAITDTLEKNHVSPLVYAYINNEEKFSYYPVDTLYSGLRCFLSNRPNDPRHRMVLPGDDLLAGEVFYFTCIEQYEKLVPVYETYKDQFHCILGQDIYSGEWWLEILPAQATKANAVLQLKKYLGCSRVVVFGDGINDIEMFQSADEAYAVENAHPALKKIATGIIGSNHADGVANWLKKRFIS